MIEMYSSGIRIRSVVEADLESVNRVIEAAVMTWVLPERVKRLSLPVYRYSCQDLAHLGMVLAEDRGRQIVGVAAWEEADAEDAPAGYCSLLLHGIYVEPLHHRQGIGRQLFGAAEAAVCQLQYDGLLVKAQQDAIGFFESLGMRSLAVEEPLHQYANRLWKGSACSGFASDF
jgi:GNAT superfamily N-acetyltransferase